MNLHVSGCGPQERGPRKPPYEGDSSHSLPPETSSLEASELTQKTVSIEHWLLKGDAQPEAFLWTLS